MLLDVRHALRSLRRSPGVSLVMVGMLALGIGASTAMFSLVDVVLLRPLPYPDADRLVSLGLPGRLADWQEHAESFDQVATVHPPVYPLLLTGDERPALLRRATVSSSFFSVVGVDPALGRRPVSWDVQRPDTYEVVISHGLWQRRYGADPAVLGRTMRFEGNEDGAAIVGVMPAGFDYPATTEAWLPAPPSYGPDLGRLAPGVGLEQARAEAEVIASQLDGETRATRTRSIWVVSLQERLVRDSRVELFFSQLLERLGTLPGVESISTTRGSVPLTGVLARSSPVSTPEGRLAGEADVDAALVAVGDDYFTTLGIPLRAGRYFNARDHQLTPQPGQPGPWPGPTVAIVNQRLADQLWPGREPVGQPLRWRSDPPEVTRTIVGVVSNVRTSGLEQAPGPQLYLPREQLFGFQLIILLRTTDDPLDIAADLRAAVTAFDPDLLVSSIRTLSDVVGDSLSTRRFTVLLVGAFAGCTVLLAALGIYAVVAYLVATRTRELGVRIALGARGVDVVRLLLRDGGRPVVAGLVIGLTTTLATTRLMTSLLFGVSPTDPMTIGGLTLGLLGISLFAIVIPAHRAARLDPMVALRHE